MRGGFPARPAAARRIQRGGDERVWGSRTRPPALTWGLCGSLVFVDEAAEDGPVNLHDLSCGSATNCVAVGSYGKAARPVAEHRP